jgi:polysaccharide biosynthesis protein PslJ
MVTIASAGVRTISPAGDAVTFLTIYLVLLIAIPSRLVFAPLGAIGTPAILLGLLGLLWWICTRLVAGLNLTRGPQPVRLAVLLFGAAIVASYAAAAARPIPILEVRAADRGLLTIASGAGIALLAADGIVTRARLEILLRRLVAAGTFLGGVGIFQFFTAFDLAPLYQLPGLVPNADFDFIKTRESVNRVAGTTLHPLEFGMILAAILPIAIYYAIHAEPRQRWRRWISLAIIATAIPMSVSRSALLGAAAAGIVLLISWPGRRRLQAIVISSVFLVAIWATIPHLLGAIRNSLLALSSDPSITHRTGGYEGAFALIGQAPILGRGFHTFLPDTYFILDNQYLVGVIELGFLGATAMVALMLVALFSARGARRRSRDPGTRDLGQALAAAVVVFFVTFAAFDAFSFPMATGVIFLIFGACGALWRLAGRPPRVAYGHHR